MKQAKKLQILLELIEQGKCECSRCEEVKPISEFYPSKWLITGLQSWCIQCCKDHFAIKITLSRAAQTLGIKTSQVTPKLYQQAKNKIISKRLNKLL